jgi:hypothetical protein
VAEQAALPMQNSAIILAKDKVSIELFLYLNPIWEGFNNERAKEYLNEILMESSREKKWKGK